jgi:hypothetical protein
MSSPPITTIIPEMWAHLLLTCGGGGFIRRALREVGARLQSSRAGGVRDTVRRGRVGGGGGADGGMLPPIQSLEAHWARERSQLRLLPMAALSPQEQQEQEAEEEAEAALRGDDVAGALTVEALRGAWVALAAVATTVVRGGQPVPDGLDSDHLAAMMEASSLDAFCYVVRQAPAARLLLPGAR